MAVLIGIPEKEVLKVKKELLDLHIKVITNYLLSRSMKLRSRKKFFIIYHFYINEKNISKWFFLPSRIFVIYLINGKIPPYKRKKSRKISNI